MKYTFKLRVPMILKIVIFFLIIAVLIKFCWTEVGGGIKALTVVDAKGGHLSEIIVIPLYRESVGIGVGPDGAGPNTDRKMIITRPYVFSSGSDFMGNSVKSTGIFLPPIIFIGTSNYIDNWLLVKEGFAPKLIHSSNIFGDPQIVMATTNADNKTNILDALLNPRNNQKILKKLFGVEEITQDITTSFDEKDIALLRKYLGTP